MSNYFIFVLILRVTDLSLKTITQHPGSGLSDTAESTLGESLAPL